MFNSLLWRVASLHIYFFYRNFTHLTISVHLSNEMSQCTDFSHELLNPEQCVIMNNTLMRSKLNVVVELFQPVLNNGYSAVLMGYSSDI